MIALLWACSTEPASIAEPAAAPKETVEAAPALAPILPPGSMRISTRLEPLQGRWQDQDDAHAEVLIIKTLWVEGHGGTEQYRGALEWADGCRSDGGKPSLTGSTLNLLTEPPRCMQVRSVSDEALEIVELPEERVRRFVRASVAQSSSSASP